MSDSSFDWRYYLNRYPDLIESGINTKNRATFHYFKYGKDEGRIPNKYVELEKIKKESLKIINETKNNNTIPSNNIDDNDNNENFRNLENEIALNNIKLDQVIDMISTLNYDLNNIFKKLEILECNIEPKNTITLPQNNNEPKKTIIPTQNNIKEELIKKETDFGNKIESSEDYILNSDEINNKEYNEINNNEPNQTNKDNTNDSFSEIIEYSNSDNDKDIFLKRINEE